MTERLSYPRVSPGGMKALLGVKAYLDGCGLAAPLLDLVYLRVSQLNGCAYCIDLHTRDLLGHGMPVGKLALIAVWEEAGELFGAQERAALAWSETVTLVAQTHVPDAAYAAAAAAFSGRELADLTIAIGLMAAFNRLAISFRSTPAAARNLS